MLSQAQRQKLRPKLAGLPAGEHARFWARADPVEFLRLSGEEPWQAQADILEALWREREVDVYSAHAIGKTWLAARAAMAWVRAWFPDVLVVILAPTEDQLVAGLWREIHQAWERWPQIMPGSPGLRSWSVEGYGVVALGRSPRPERPGTLQGLHSQNLLLIIDEAAEIDERLWSAARSLLTGANTRLLAIGNPTNDAGEFYRRSTGRPLPGQVSMRVSAFDSPNLAGLDPDSPTLRDDLVARLGAPVSHPGLIDARYVLGVLDEGLEREWKTRVLAEFPQGGDDVLIPRAWVERARGQDLDRRRRVEGKLMAGVDIARMGSDRSVLFARMGGVVFPPLVWGQVDLMVTAGKLAAWMRENAPETVWIDEGGMGIGVVDRLVEQGFPVRAFKHNESPRNAIKFDDRRTEYWYALRTSLERNEVDLTQLDEESYRTLSEELCAPRYSFTSAGKIKIEQKIKTKDRLKRSPDLADALVYSSWEAPVAYYVGTFGD